MSKYMILIIIVLQRKVRVQPHTHLGIDALTHLNAAM